MLDHPFLFFQKISSETYLVWDHLFQILLPIEAEAERKLWEYLKVVDLLIHNRYLMVEH